ncbi:MAG TPA: hypothetical protein VN436_03705, partial [Holophaga sp.]|nr:hypothetical protein [Holophaga sp.]
MAEAHPSLFGDGSGWTGTIEDVSPLALPTFPDYERDESQAMRHFLLEEEGPAMAKRIYRR